MQKKIYTFALALILATPVIAMAFEINPAHEPEVIKRSLKSEYRRFLSRLSTPTHEELTKMSLRCAEEQADGSWCDLGPAGLLDTEKLDLDVLRMGARWNDDPNNYFRVQKEIAWFVCLEAASVYPLRIGSHQPLEYRSHYGDLQFLHGMGRRGESPTAVRDNILAWSQFAYDVATAKISPSTKLVALEDKYAFARNFSRTSKSNWTVRKLFTNVGGAHCMDSSEQLEATDKEVAGLALGALLHTVQDSYSHSHVERSNIGVHAWLDYRQQNPECHGRADKDTAWVTDEKVKAKPAIKWGGWVIRNAVLRTGWDDGVREKLAQEVFVLDQHPKEPYDGGFKIGGSNCEFTAGPDERG
jgi:hypothetical protein